MFQNLHMFKKLDLYLKKIQISFLIGEKFRSASNEDADPFFIKKNSNLHLRRMQICIYFKKNSDPHLS